MMKKYSGAAAAVCIGLLAMICTSCPEVMSTTWARWAKRAPKIPAITSDNIDSLVDATVGDPDFAGALLETIRKEIPGKEGEEKAKLQGAAITAAANGSGLDIAVVTHLGGLINSTADGELDKEGVHKITETFGAISDEVNRETIHYLAEDLTAVLLSHKGGGKAEDEYKGKYWENPPVATDSLLMSIVVLLIAEADNQKAKGFDEYLKIFQEKRSNISIEDFLTPNERAILILVKLLVKQGNATFGNLLEGLKLGDVK
jgi:hypothetical protein